MSEDSMPSKRMVPEQEIAELSDEFARKLASVTRERDEAEKSREAWATQYVSEMAALTEQRDRALAVVEAARKLAWYTGSSSDRRDREYAALQNALVAALDTPSSPSLPESPEA
jgi:DNA-binding protein H-NS